MTPAPDPEGVLGRVLASAERAPGAPAFVVGDRSLTYRDLLSLWAAAVSLLQAQGVGKGRRIALTMGQSPVQVVMLLAITRLGAVAVPVSPFLSEAHRAAVFARLGLEAVVADRPEYAPPGVPLIHVPQLAAAPSAAALEAAGSWPVADDLFALSLTTGTTGLPKAIAHTHDSLARRVMRNVYGAGCVPRVLPPGLHIIVSVGAVLHALFEGGTVVFPRTYEAAGLLEAIGRHQVTHVMMPPANMANLARASAGPFDSLRQVRFLGGTPSRALVALARERLSPHLLAVYATVETATIAYAGGDLLEREPGTTGRACVDARIEVVDDEDRVLPAGEPGHLRVQVACMARGYFGPDAEERSRFRGGWYYTRDVGRLTPEGLLFVEGRSDDILNIGGRKVLPSALESWLEEFPGVREAAVFLRPGSDRLEAAIVSAETLDVAALARFAAEKLELLAPVRFHQVPGLPRNAMGKLQREKLVL